MTGAVAGGHRGGDGGMQWRALLVAGLHRTEHGLQPRIMAAQFVTPFRKRSANKNNRNDAEAIVTAARQGNVVLPVKSIGVRRPRGQTPHPVLGGCEPSPEED